MILAGQYDYMLFDGDCGLCNFCAQHAQRMDRRKRWQIAPYQSVPESELQKFGITRAHCAKQLHVISRRGRIHRGAFAVNSFLLRHFPWSILIVLIYALPALLLLEIIGYALVARHRHRISSCLGLAACRLVTIEQNFSS